MRQLDDASDYMSDPINKSMEHMAITDPEAQYQHFKYSKRINKQLLLCVQSDNEFKSNSSYAFLK